MEITDLCSRVVGQSHKRDKCCSSDHSRLELQGRGYAATITRVPHRSLPVSFLACPVAEKNFRHFATSSTHCKRFRCRRSRVHPSIGVSVSHTGNGLCPLGRRGKRPRRQRDNARMITEENHVSGVFKHKKLDSSAKRENNRRKCRFF